MNQTCSPRKEIIFSLVQAFLHAIHFIWDYFLCPSLFTRLRPIDKHFYLHQEALLDLLVSAYSIPMLWLCTAMIFLWGSTLSHCALGECGRKQLDISPMYFFFLDIRGDYISSLLCYEAEPISLCSVSERYRALINATFKYSPLKNPSWTHILFPLL